MFVVPPEMKQEILSPEPIKRDHLGRILPGQKALPGAGRPPKDEAERRYKSRARELMNQYTIGQMKKMVKNGDFDDLHAWDAVIIRNILAAATQGGQELKILLDRVEGGVQRQQEETPPSGSTTYNQTLVIKQYGTPSIPKS